MSIRNKIKIILAIFFIAFLVNSYLSYTLEKQSESKIDLIEHSHKTIHVATQLLESLKDAETGQRGFLLTLDPTYLEPYYQGVKKSSLYYNMLRNNKLLNNHRNEQIRRLEKIKVLMSKKLKELKETISLAKKNRLDEALALVKQDIGKYYMDEIRFTMQELLQTEDKALQKHKNEYIFNKSRNFTLLVVILTFFILFSFYILLHINNSLFKPLELLLTDTDKIDRGEYLNPKDIVTQDEIGHLLASFYKMSEKIKHRENHLTYIAHHDELTNLPNRTKVYEDIDAAITKAKQQNSKVAIMFLDLNKFKEINDSLGHEAGDLLLIEASTRFLSAIRNDDKIYRIGGDEFLILLENITDLTNTNRVVEQLLSSIQEPIFYQKDKLQISVSIGIALFPDNGKTSDELIKAADIAMYAAKKDTEVTFKYFNDNLLHRSFDK